MVKYLIILLIAVNIMACRQSTSASVNVDSALLKTHTLFGLTIELNGTEKAYFAHNGKPLLSFGGGPGDMMLWLNYDAFDYKRWANWEADFGMNHSRDYPPLSWKGIEVVTSENGGAIENCLFPFDETKTGSRKFDLSKFNTAYWKQFREKMVYLQSKGIIVHLLMWNGWNTNPKYSDDKNFTYHFFNPDNNINICSDSVTNWQKLYYSVADNNTELIGYQKAWFCKLIEETYDLDNVYYDLVHEMGDLVENDLDWEKGKLWVAEMAGATRDKWNELNPDRPIIIGMDGGIDIKKEKQANLEYFTYWIYSQPYFDVIIWGKSHIRERAVDWRIKFKKPYIGQEIWDDNGDKYRLRYPDENIHIRKFYWKFMMFKCQQLDLYHKPYKDKPYVGYPVNYDPYGYSPFENHATRLREFWNTINDYPNLWFRGEVSSGPGVHQYVLSSEMEAIIYLSSATGADSVKYESEFLIVKNTSLKDGNYSLNLFSPREGLIGKKELKIEGNGFKIKLPEFMDDFALHVLAIEVDGL